MDGTFEFCLLQGLNIAAHYESQSFTFSLFIVSTPPSLPVKPGASAEENEVHAKAGLLLGELLKRTGMSHSNSVIAQYKDVVTLRPEWEKGVREGLGLR